MTRDDKDDKLDRILDAALEMTFPASDPIAVQVEDLLPGAAAAHAHEEPSLEAELAA